MNNLNPENIKKTSRKGNTELISTIGKLIIFLIVCVVAYKLLVNGVNAGKEIAGIAKSAICKMTKNIIFSGSC